MLSGYILLSCFRNVILMLNTTDLGTYYKFFEMDKSCQSALTMQPIRRYTNYDVREKIPIKSRSLMSGLDFCGVKVEARYPDKCG